MLRVNRHQFKKTKASFVHADGHRYSEKYNTSDSTVYYCDFRGCKAKARVDLGGTVIVDAIHSHMPSAVFNRVKEIRIELRAEAQTGRAPPARHLLANIANNLNGEELEVIDPDRVRRMLNYNRRMATDEEIALLDRAEPEFVGQQRMIQGRPFLIYDSCDLPTDRGLHRVTIFASEIALRQLQLIGKMCGDGTMKCLSNSIYSQLYIIGGMWDAHSYVPLIYVMMQGNSQDTYRRAFEKIKQLAPAWNINSFMCDMELGVVNVVRYLFPACEVTYCNFHLVKSWKDSFVRLLGNINDGQQSDTYYKIMALPYLPADDIYAEFPRIEQSAPVELAGFLQYIRVNYASLGCRYPAEHWSVYNCLLRNEPRTNNSLESQNAKLNESVRIYSGHRKTSTVSSCLKAVHVLEGSRALSTRNSLVVPNIIPGMSLAKRTNSQKEFDRAAIQKIQTFRTADDRLYEISRLLKSRRMCL